MIFDHLGSADFKSSQIYLKSISDNGRWHMERLRGGAENKQHEHPVEHVPAWERDRNAEEKGLKPQTVKNEDQK